MRSAIKNKTINLSPLSKEKQKIYEFREVSENPVLIEGVKDAAYFLGLSNPLLLSAYGTRKTKIIKSRITGKTYTVTAKMISK